MEELRSFPADRLRLNRFPPEIPSGELPPAEFPGRVAGLPFEDTGEEEGIFPPEAVCDFRDGELVLQEKFAGLPHSAGPAIFQTLQSLPPVPAPTPRVLTDFKFICPCCGQHQECPPELENVTCECPSCHNSITPVR